MVLFQVHTHPAYRQYNAHNNGIYSEYLLQRNKKNQAVKSGRYGWWEDYYDTRLPLCLSGKSFIKVHPLDGHGSWNLPKDLLAPSNVAEATGTHQTTSIGLEVGRGCKVSVQCGCVYAYSWYIYTQRGRD
jgi:hypothetical protein